MNIAILIPQFPPGDISGAELQAQGWARRLSSRHRVTVITRRAEAPLLGPDDCDGYTVVWKTDSRLSVRGVRTVAGIVAGLKAVRSLRPKPDLLLCFESFPSGLAGVLIGRRLDIPALVWIRGEHAYRLRESWYLRFVNPYVWKRAALVLVQTEKGRSDMLSELSLVSPRNVAAVAAKLAVVGNGVELPGHSPFPADGPVLCVARLHPDKGVDVVIDACAAAGRPLVIAGRGSERAALEARAAALGADVRFTGFAVGDELDRLYREASVVVLASRREGLPNVLLEAMAHGRPVVSTPVGGIPDLVDDGVNGIMVPVDDPVALESVLTRLADDPVLGEKLGAQARSTAKGFEWCRVQLQLEDIMERWDPQ